MNLIDFCLWILFSPFFIFCDSMQMCVIKTYQCQHPSTSASFKKNHSIWLISVYSFQRKGIQAVSHWWPALCWLQLAHSKKIEDLIFGVRDFGGLFTFLVGYVSIWRWCPIAADTALRFWKFQRKNVLNNYFCLLQSAQILLIYWSLWFPQTVPERLTGHLKACSWLVPAPQSLVTDGSCFSNSLHMLHLPTPQFSLLISLLCWRTENIFFFSMTVSSVLSLALFHILTKISAFTGPAVLGLPGMWQDVHHHMT